MVSESHTPLVLELFNCATSVNKSGIEMIIPGGSCIIRLSEDNLFAFEREFKYF